MAFDIGFWEATVGSQLASVTKYIKRIHLKEAVTMFETLEDQIKIDDLRATTERERMVRWVVIPLLSVVLFGALYFGLHLMQ